MNVCLSCRHPILFEEDFGSVLNHELHCPSRAHAERSNITAFNQGYMDRLCLRQSPNENPAYILGWQQADTYLLRKQLEKKFKSP